MAAWAVTLIATKVAITGVLLSDLDRLDHHVVVRTIHAVGGHTGDLRSDLLGLLVGDRTEEGVAGVQVRGGRHRGEDVGAAGARACSARSQQGGALHSPR